MNDNTAIPLHVYQVLEEEYVSLYGPIPPAEVLLVEIPVERTHAYEERGRTRTVEATLDWRFRRGHLKDPAGLAADLLLAAGPSAQAEGGRNDLSVKGRLRTYLLGVIPRPTLDALAAWEPAAGGPEEPPREHVAALEEALNDVLRREDFYEAERFPKVLLGHATRGLARLRDHRKRFVTAGAAAVEAEEAAGAEGREYRTPLAHFNRLLLEDAFPEYVEKIHNIRLAAIHQRLHLAEPKALSLSGGGIRSGTLALGLIQGLSRHNLLEKFDYLSTVSGGGYIGSWLTAWLHRHVDGMRGVTHDLKNSDPVSKVDPDPQPLQYLRRFSNFLTPKAGFLTADTWSFIGIYFRNLLLNWLVFVPLLLCVLMLPRLMLTLTTRQPVAPPVAVASLPEGQRLDAEALKKLEGVPESKRVVYRPKPLVENFFSGRLFNLIYGEGSDDNLYWRHFLLLAGFLLGVWALGYIGFNRPSERGALMRRSPYWRDRTDQGSFLRYCLLPLVLSAACLTTFWAWSQEGARASKNLVSFLAFGLLFTLLGWLIASVVLGRFRQRKKGGALGFRSILLAGLLGGLLFWVLSLFDLGGSPVVGYGVEFRDGQLLRAPFPWTDWTKWSWSDWTTELYVCLGVPIFLLIFWAATTFFVGASSFDKRIDDEDREWWARFGAWLLIAALAWLTACAVVIFVPLALLASPKLLGTIGGLSGLVAVLVARSAKTSAREAASDEKDKSKTAAAAGMLGSSLTMLGLVFLAAFLALLSLTTTGITRKLALLTGEHLGGAEWLTNIENDSANAGFADYARYITPVVPTLVRPAPTPQPGAPTCQPVCTSGPAGDDNSWKLEEADAYTGAHIAHLNVLHHTSFRFNFALALVFGLLGWWLSRRINLNLFSLHGGYRDRLIRGFLGASRPAGERHPNPFTGFDPADNIHMHELRWALLDEGDLLDPSGLARQLLKQEGAGARANPLSDYLLERELLKELRNLPNLDPSPSLTGALRADLNRVLETEKLYALGFAGDYLKSRRAAAIRGHIVEAMEEATGKPWKDKPLEQVPLRSEYGMLLNRLVIEEAYPKTLKPGLPPPYKMLHVVNTTLNLVGGDNLAWQQRKAEPFSVTPLHSGCFRVGYRRSREYGGPEGITLGTAAAVSGAAASSNMGYYTTSPVISLLLTLFNVRLGWWLGNPGPAGNDTYRLRAPRNSVRPVVEEAFGLTDDQHPYVYLTDGGHFENLALYEMVLRRCHIIVCSDGAEDREYRFGDLGSAVRKIRIDLGVSIDFPCMEIHNPDTLEPGRQATYWALGRIRYSCVDRLKKQPGQNDDEPDVKPAPDGVLLYIKPAVYGNEPRDVLEYKKSFPDFPNQSTGDQFFDEPQFESYRALGSFIMDQICGSEFRPLDLRQVVGRAFARLHAVCRANGNPLDAGFADWLSQLSGFKIVDGEVRAPE